VKEHTVGLSIIALLVVGLVVGVLARLVLPGRQSLPVWLTLLIGVGSALIAGAIIPGYNHRILELILAVIIAAVIIALSQGAVRSRSRA